MNSTTNNIGMAMSTFVTTFQGLRCIDKERLSSFIERNQPKDVRKSRRNPAVIVSLTSFQERLDDIHYCLYSLFNQTMQPDEVILWLPSDGGKRVSAEVPKAVSEYVAHGLSIRWTSDIGPYEKSVPTLREYPDAVVVTADDDIYYVPDWLEILFTEYLRSSSFVHCHRAHRLVWSAGKIAQYNMWKREISGRVYLPSNHNFATGCGGILYPPRCFPEEALCAELFLSLCPTNDDIWFWAMTVLNRRQINVASKSRNSLVYINPVREMRLSEENTLARINVMEGGNDVQLQRMINNYPELCSILLDKHVCNRQLGRHRPGPVEVVFIADENYVVPTAAAINSLLESKSSGTRCSITVFGVDLSEKSKNLLIESAEKADIDIKDLKNKYLEFKMAQAYVTTAALFKFDIPHLLPEKEKVLYLDSDTIVLKDLTKLYDICVDSCYAAVVKDMLGTISGHDKRVETENYFNSGVMLLNLHEMRQRDIPSLLLEYKQSHNSQFMDQDAFNVVFADQVIYLSPTYNMMCSNLDFPIEKIAAFYNTSVFEMKDHIVSPSILHLTNYRKPWRIADAPFSFIWNGFASEVNDRQLPSALSEPSAIDTLSAATYWKLLRSSSWHANRHCATRIAQDIDIRNWKAENQDSRIRELDSNQVRMKETILKKESELAAASALIGGLRSELADAFDQIKLNDLRAERACSRVKELEDSIERIEGEKLGAQRTGEDIKAQLMEAMMLIQDDKLRVQDLSQQINVMLHSRSWRITSPLRNVVNFMRRLLSRIERGR